MNKKILFSILLGTLILAGCPLSPAFALNYKSSPVDLQGIVDNIGNAVWIIFTGVAVVCLVIAGILFLVAQGQPDKLQQARSALIWGVVGVAVAIVAYSIIAITKGVLGVG